MRELRLDYSRVSSGVRVYNALFTLGLGDIGIYCHDISWQKYHGITIYYDTFNFSQIMQWSALL